MSSLSAETKVEEYCTPALAKAVLRQDPFDRTLLSSLSAPKLLTSPTVNPADSDDASDQGERKSPARKAQISEAETAFVESVRKYLSEFEFTPDCCELELSAKIPRAVRQNLHDALSGLGLETHSRGWRESRHLVVQNWASLVQGDRVTERFVFHGYLALEGPYVDAVAAQDHALVTSQMRRKRELRDGQHYHITVLSRKEFEGVCATDEFKDATPADVAATLLTKLLAEVPNTWEDKGIGRVPGERENVVYFRVVNWPEANVFRQSLGLAPATFHITVGYVKADVHDVNKDESTLVSDADVAAELELRNNNNNSSSSSSSSSNDATDNATTNE